MAGSMRLAAAPLGRSASAAPVAARHLTSFGPAQAQVQTTRHSDLHPVVTSSSPAASDLGPRAPRPSPVPVPRGLSATYFDTSGVLWVELKGQHQPPDPNKAKLGKSTPANPPFAAFLSYVKSAAWLTLAPLPRWISALRILQERLPTLLQSPLPQEILAPNISLQLFPTTHPHLPSVSGRVAYNAALWTSPIAWNRVPIIGNVKLEILAERMTSEPITFLPRRAGAIPEQLVVRWCERRKPQSDPSESGGGGGIARSLRFGRGADPKKAFTGLFIFDFDRDGRILTHTIEQAQDCGNWEKGMGAKFVGLTDWLLGGIKEPGQTPLPMFEKWRRRRHERKDWAGA